MVFPERTKQNKLDESEFMMMYDAMGVLQSMYPSKEIMVAALGAIKKPDGSVRPLHDGTHYVQVNNRIVINDQLQYPGPQDTAGVVREVRDSRGSVFPLSADISAVYRRVKSHLGEQGWGIWNLVCSDLVVTSLLTGGTPGDACYGSREIISNCVR